MRGTARHEVGDVGSPHSFSGLVRTSCAIASRGVSGLCECVVIGDECAVSGLGPVGESGAPLPGLDAPPGFHELRCQLFFLRTLALYAARIAAVASCACAVLAERTDAALGGRKRKSDANSAGGVAISRRGWRSEAAGEGSTQGEGGPDSQDS